MHLLRFGPGRLSRRHHQTERLRELRTRRASGPTTRDYADGIPLPKSRALAGRNRPEKQDEQCDADTTGNNTAASNKRRRGRPSGGARQLSRQRFSEKASSTELALVPKKSTPLELACPTNDSKCKQPTVMPEDNVGAHNDNCGDGSDPHKSGSKNVQINRGGRDFPQQDGVAGDTTRLSVGRLASCNSRSKDTDVRVGTRCSTPTPPPITRSISSPMISPVRSAPASRRPRATKAVGISRSMTEDTQRAKTAQQCDRSLSRSMTDAQRYKSTQQHDRSLFRSMSEDTRRAKTAQECERRNWRPRIGGGNSTSKAGNAAGVASVACGVKDVNGEYGAFAESGDASPVSPPEPSIDKQGMGYPGIPGACGGIVLRLSPEERSLEPWSNAVTPFRAICDIEPSLSRAGLECRGVINAVEAARETKSQDRAKVRKAEAKRGTHTATYLRRLRFRHMTLRVFW